MLARTLRQCGPRIAQLSPLPRGAWRVFRVFARRVRRASDVAGTGFRGAEGAAAATLSRSAYGVRAWRDLIVVDILLAALAFVVPFVLPVLAILQTGPRAFVAVEWSVSLMVVLTGLLGGGAFPLAAHLQHQLTRRTAAAAGIVDSADHGGACLGALLCGILLVPIFGTTAAAFLLAGTKAASAAAMAVLGRPR